MKSLESLTTWLSKTSKNAKLMSTQTVKRAQLFNNNSSYWQINFLKMLVKLLVKLLMPCLKVCCPWMEQPYLAQKDNLMLLLCQVKD